MAPKAKMSRQLGQYMTSEADAVLDGFEDLVVGKDVIDLYCGHRDLLNWAVKNGAKSVIGYDVDPEMPADIHMDTLLHPPKQNSIVLINPPYLYINKADNTEIYHKYNTTDLYKCAILSLQCDEFIAIVPSNFLFDADDSFRIRFYSKYSIKRLVIFDKQTFKDTNVRVCVVYCETGCTETILGHRLYKTRLGYEWQKYTDITPICKRLVIGGKPNGNLTIHMTDTGSSNGMIHAYVSDEPYYGKTSDRNLMTVVLPNVDIDINDLVEEFNSRLNYYREMYDSCFLTNFLAGKDGTMRKRMSFKQALQLITKIIRTKL